jgi:hypothetical protein
MLRSSIGFVTRHGPGVSHISLAHMVFASNSESAVVASERSCTTADIAGSASGIDRGEDDSPNYFGGSWRDGDARLAELFFDGDDPPVLLRLRFLYIL